MNRPGCRARCKSVTAIGLKDRRRDASLHIDWQGATAVLSHAADQPLDLWRLLRAEAHPDVLVVSSDRALREPGCARLLRSVVEEAVTIGGVRRVWVAADGVGRPDEMYAPWLTDLAVRTGVELLAPDGPVIVVPGGSRYAAGGTGAWGWRSFRAGGGCPVSANRCPTPAWEPGLPDRPTTLGRLVADPVPAGMLLRSATSAPATAGEPAFRIPIDPHGPVLVLRQVGCPPATPAEVASLFAGLPAHFPVRVETALLDTSDGVPQPAWFDALAALLGDAPLPEPAAVEPALEAPPATMEGWRRTGNRLYRHQTVDLLLAEVVPMGVLLRPVGGYASADLALVDPVAGRLVLGSEVSPVLREAARLVWDGPGDHAAALDPPATLVVAETLRRPTRPAWASSETVALTIPLRQPAVTSEPVAPVDLNPLPLTPPAVAEAPKTTVVPPVVVAPEPVAPRPAPPVHDVPSTPPVVDAPTPQLRLAGIGPIPAMRTISGPDVTEAPSAEQDPRWVSASGERVADRPSTVEEQNALAAALGAAFHDSITTVNAALAAWPALRREMAAAEKSDLVAVRAFLGTSAHMINAALRAGQTPETPGYLPCLVSGLRRLPPYRRAVVGQGRLGVPARRLYLEGATLVEPAFRSVSARIDVCTEDADVDFMVWSRSARQVGALAERSDLDEGVFLAGSRFRVLALSDDPGTDRGALPATAVLLRELLPGDAEGGRGLDDDDRAVLRRLHLALERRRSATPRLVSDVGAADRLAGPPLGFVERALTANAS